MIVMINRCVLCGVRLRIRVFMRGSRRLEDRELSIKVLGKTKGKKRKGK